MKYNRILSLHDYKIHSLKMKIKLKIQK
jgi:hypothetical protein